MCASKKTGFLSSCHFCVAFFIRAAISSLAAAIPVASGWYWKLAGHVYSHDYHSDLQQIDKQKLKSELCK